MSWNTDDERRVSRALGGARDTLVLLGRKLVGGDIVFETICFAADVERRQKVQGHAPRKLKAMLMEYIRTPDEHEADFRQRMIEIAMGDPIDEVFGIVSQPSPHEIDTMDSINDMFRSCIVGHCKERDWKILHLMALPKATAHSVGMEIGRTRALVSDRRKLQCGAIWSKVKHLLPTIAGSSGTVWKDCVA
jgi:hypothetical protein